jgi:hypothetical protein
MTSLRWLRTFVRSVTVFIPRQTGKMYAYESLRLKRARRRLERTPQECSISIPMECARTEVNKTRKNVYDNLPIFRFLAFSPEETTTPRPRARFAQTSFAYYEHGQEPDGLSWCTNLIDDCLEKKPYQLACITVYFYYTCYVGTLVTRLRVHFHTC